MATYDCKAIDSEGIERRSRVEAASRSEAIAKLHSLGLLATSIVEARISAFAHRKLNAATIARIYSLLTNQIEVGVPLLKALQVIRESESSPAAHRLLDDVIQRVASGSSLSQSLSFHRSQFDATEVNVVRAGEEGGFLHASLQRIVQLREWQQSMMASLWGALAYPILLVVVASVILPSIMIFIVPRFEPLYGSLRSSGRMPWITSSLLAVSNCLEHYGLWAGILGFASAIFVFRVARSRQQNPWLEDVIERLPLAGTLFQTWSLAQFCRVLGMLLENRVPLLTALEVAARSSGSHRLLATIEEARNSIGKGSMLASPLARSGHIGKDIVAMISVAEQSNTLATTLVKIATQLESNFKRKLELSVKLVEPLLLLILAIFVGTIVIALLLPIFENNGLG